MDRVVNMREVTRLRAVAVDRRRLAGQQRFGKRRDHRRIGAVGILPRAKNIEVAQARRVRAPPAGIAARPGPHQRLARNLGRRVRAQRLGRHRLNLGQRLGITVSRAARSEHHPPHPLGPGRLQHVQRAGGVHVVKRPRLLHTAGHAAQRRLVKHQLGTGGRIREGLAVHDRVFHHPQAPACRRPQRVQVGPIGPRQVVDHHHLRPKGQQGLGQVRTNKARPAGHQRAAALESLAMQRHPVGCQIVSHVVFHKEKGETISKPMPRKRSPAYARRRGICPTPRASIPRQ